MVEENGCTWKSIGNGLEELRSIFNEPEGVYRKSPSGKSDERRRQWFLPKAAINWTKLAGKKIPNRDDVDDVLSEPEDNHLVMSRYYGVVRNGKLE